ncbi:MAG: hypothetical protein U9R05_04485 [Chloroflexota bacterium]|nr:hypothetical protein [Chloroflexota bacterium]
MGWQTTVKVEDMTNKAPGSNLAAVVRFGPQDRYVEVFKSGIVRLVSPAGTVSAQFREMEKRDLLRQSYIQTLLAGGVRGKKLERALQAIARVDRRLDEETDAEGGVADLERRTQARLRAWAKERDLDHDSLSEDEFMARVQQGVTEIRRAS